MKKAFFFDVDGTLIDSPNGLLTLTAKSIEALKKLTVNNYVFIASGRGITQMLDDIYACKPDGFLYQNGGYIVIDNKEISKSCFDIQLLREVNEFAKKHEGLILLERADSYMCEAFDKMAYQEFSEEWQEEIPIKEFRELKDDDQILKMDAYFRKQKDADEFERLFGNKTKCTKQIVPRGFDIVPLGVSKGVGIKTVLDLININHEDTYCFGDGENDVEMFKLVAHPIAMGNASDNVKVQAEFVCDDVLNDGVYKWLKEHSFID